MKIKMYYPNDPRNKNYDGKPHTIVPLDLKDIDKNGMRIYLMTYEDKSLGKEMYTILQKSSVTGSKYV